MFSHVGMVERMWAGGGQVEVLDEITALKSWEQKKQLINMYGYDIDPP
jgi:hypothetical protein